MSYYVLYSSYFFYLENAQSIARSINELEQYTVIVSNLYGNVVVAHMHEYRECPIKIYDMIELPHLMAYQRTPHLRS